MAAAVKCVFASPRKLEVGGNNEVNTGGLKTRGNSSLVCSKLWKFLLQTIGAKNCLDTLMEIKQLSRTITDRKPTTTEQ